MKFFLSAMFATALGIVGCSSDSNSDDKDNSNSSSSGGGSSSSGGSSERTGVTPCGDFPDGPKSCQAGQYCEDERASECATGCLTENNCPAGQSCVKNGDQVGTCEKGKTEEKVDCADVCTKLKTCDEQITNAQCDKFCKGMSKACQQCVLDANCTALNDNDSTVCKSECDL